MVTRAAEGIFERTIALDLSPRILAAAGPIADWRLAADTDALPMADKKDVSYASTIKSAAHCCGHDGHTAMLMGAADLLCNCQDSLKGNVKFIFQPSEDRIPGGALPMIKAGVLENPGVDGIFSLHLNPEFPEGTVAVKSG